MTLHEWLLASNTGLQALGLGFLVKLIFNDLHEIRSLLIEHLRDHSHKR